MTDDDSPAAPVRYADAASRPYDLIVAVFCGMLLISNVAATKLIEFTGVPLIGSLVTDGGAILFPLTYVLGDVLAEVYGLRGARRAIWLGFALAFLMAACLAAVDAAPAASEWGNQAAWHGVLGFVPRIVLASLAGYLAGQFLNALVVVAMKARSRESALWARLLGSTLVGELADTAVFCTIAFGPLGAWLGGGSVSAGTLLNYVAVGWAYKCAVEALCLPVTYRVIAAVKRREPGYWTPQ